MLPCVCAWKIFLLNVCWKLKCKTTFDRKKKKKLLDIGMTTDVPESKPNRKFLFRLIHSDRNIIQLDIIECIVIQFGLGYFWAFTMLADVFNKANKRIKLVWNTDVQFHLLRVEYSSFLLYKTKLSNNKNSWFSKIVSFVHRFSFSLSILCYAGYFMLFETLLRIQHKQTRSTYRAYF